MNNIVLALALVGGVEGLLSVFVGTSNTGTKGGAIIGTLSGWFVGSVWVFLFALLGLSRGLTEIDDTEIGGRASQAILILLVACALYPLYTFGLSNDDIGLLGNIITLALTFWSAWRVAQVRPTALVGPLAVAAWLVFATIVLIDEKRWLG